MICHKPQRTNHYTTSGIPYWISVVKIDSSIQITWFLFYRNCFFTLSLELRIHWLYPLLRVKISSPKKSILGMTLNSICSWGPNSGALGNVEYFPSCLLLSGLFWLKVVVTIRASSMAKIYLFKIIIIQ